MVTAGTSLPFLIVGGGIGGLATAYALARQGFPVRVFEQARDFWELGAGILMGANIFRALDRIGLKDEMLVDAWQPGKLEMRDALTGETISSVPLGARFLERFQHPYAVTHRADVVSVLLDACRTQDLISLEPDSRVADFKDTDEDVVLWLDDGEQIRGRALIGCDGLWSHVRAKIIGDGAPHDSGYIAYGAVLKCEEVPEGLWQPDVSIWVGPHTHFVHYPLRRGALYNLLAVFESKHRFTGWTARGDPDELWRSFTDHRPELTRLIERVESWRVWVLGDRDPTKNWSRGRTTLLGDAAHPMLIYLPQGASMATEDAVTLAEKVAATPHDISGAFEAYQEARYLRTGRVQLAARACGEFYHRSGVAAELRRQKLKGRTPEQAYDVMAWLYGGP